MKQGHAGNRVSTINPKITNHKEKIKQYTKHHMDYFVHNKVCEIINLSKKIESHINDKKNNMGNDSQNNQSLKKYMEYNGKKSYG